MRRAAGEVAVRFVLFCAALGLLRWGTVSRATWQDDFSSSFEFDWGLWAGWVALVVGAGLLVGLACAPDRPNAYRARVPLATTVPALLLLGHFQLLYGSIGPDGTDLPWILANTYFYMETPPQFALAMIAGFGLAAGLRTAGPPVSSTGGTEPPSAG